MDDLPDSVHLHHGRHGPVVEIDHPQVGGRIHLHGAHLTSWAPASPGTSGGPGRDGRREHLWLSPRSRFGPGEAIRGGVPICFPWFALGPGDWEPQHGFARRVPWRLLGVEANAAGVAVRLGLADTDLPADTPGRQRWPYRFAAEYVVGLGGELSIDLTVTNTGDSPFPVGGALHTYLAVTDIAEVSLGGLDGVGYLDKVADTERVQQGPVRFDGETDRVYAGTGPVSMHDGAADRLVVHSSGASHTVVWNPGPDKAASMADVPDDGWPGLVCVEAAVPCTDQAEVAPGTAWHLGQHIVPASTSG